MTDAPLPRWADSYPSDVPLRLEHDDATLVDGYEHAVQQFGDRPALDFLGRSTTYAQFGEKVERVAEGLRRLGVGPGDRVALIMPACPQNVIAFHAVLRLGATAVEHNPLYTAAELRAPFVDHGASVAIAWDAVVPMLEELRESTALETIVAIDLTQELPWSKRLLLKLPIAKARESRAALTQPAPGAVAWSTLTEAPRLDPTMQRPHADDVALLLYTSGTTGVPKGVALTHRNLVANVKQGLAWVPGLVPGKETFLLPLPLFHAYGVTIGMLCGIHLAAHLVLLPKPELPLIMEAIKRKVPTFVPAVPPLYQRIVDEAEATGVSIRGIRYSLSGAMPLPADLVERWEHATGGLLVEGYGLTETAPVVVGNPMSTKRRPGSIGVPFPDVDVRIVDPEDPATEVPLGDRGELLVRGPQVFSGYRGLPEETEKAFHEGWFRTGDIVTMAEDGFITVVDRIKEIIITGGFNVYPSEVETVLREHDAIEDVAVVGVKQDSGSEEVVAAVVAAPGAAVDTEAVRRWAKHHLTGYKVPRRVVLVDELPRNLMGKVLRKDVVPLVS